MEMTVPVLNCFCRKYDLIFVEEGQVKREPVYRFIDFQNQHRYYTAAEISDKIKENFVDKS
jgi:hypothetical protein